MVEGAALEKRCAREGTAGSNPALSVLPGGTPTARPPLVLGEVGAVDKYKKDLERRSGLISTGSRRRRLFYHYKTVPAGRSPTVPPGRPLTSRPPRVIGAAGGVGTYRRDAVRQSSPSHRGGRRGREFSIESCEASRSYMPRLVLRFWKTLWSYRPLRWHNATHAGYKTVPAGRPLTSRPPRVIGAAGGVGTYRRDAVRQSSPSHRGGRRGREFSIESCEASRSYMRRLVLWFWKTLWSYKPLRRSYNHRIETTIFMSIRTSQLR